MSAKMFGVECSTVDGRLMISGFSLVAPNASTTASTTRFEKSSSVPENISGEYSKRQSVPGFSSASRRARRACLTASRSEEHTSELQSLMRISYAVFCLKKKKNNNKIKYETTNNT